MLCNSVASDRYVEASAACYQNIVVMTNDNQREVLRYRGLGYAEATLGEKGLAGFTLALALPLVAARVKASATSNAQNDITYQTGAVLTIEACKKTE